MLTDYCQIWKWQDLCDAALFRCKRGKRLTRDVIHQFAQTANGVCHSFSRLLLSEFGFGHSGCVAANQSLISVPIFFSAELLLLPSDVYRLLSLLLEEVLVKVCLHHPMPHRPDKQCSYVCARL